MVDHDSLRPDLLQHPKETSTDLKLDLLANQLKINVVDSDSSESAEVIDVEASAVPPPPPPPPLYHPPPPVSTTAASFVTDRPAVHLPKTPEPNERYRKVELLRIFQELENRGIKLSTAYSIHSSLDDMEQEYEVLKSIENKRQAVRLYKGFMINGIQALEFLNEAYNPFDFHLKGWSEHVSLTSDDYNEVFGEIYEKYKNTGRKIEPELKLVIMIMMSATTFHTSNSLLKGVFGARTSGGGPVPPVVEEPVMKGPDPREFLNRLRKERSVAPPPVEPVIIEEEDSSSDRISSSTITTTTKRRKPPMVINL